MTNRKRLESEIKANRFYEELERLLKRYKPDRFGPAVANMIYELMDKPDQWRYYPLHILVHSIEANCAFHRDYLDDPVTEKCLNRIYNHYKSYYDPYLKFLLSETDDPHNRLYLAFLAMQRQQFLVQNKPSQMDLARSLLLFIKDDPLPTISSAFSEYYGLSMNEWVYMCFAVLALVNDRRPPVFRAENYLDADIISLRKECVIPFLEKSSLSPIEIGNRYKDIRKQIPPYLHIFLPSVFIDFPLISYENGEYLAPHPFLILSNSQSGLFRLCNAIDQDHFSYGFSKSFESYAEKVLHELPNVIRILREREIIKESQGRVCDFVIDLPESILLIECKAIRYSSQLLTENAIAKDNSTGKIAEAFEQLWHTALRIRSGELTNLIENYDKPLYGLCITFGDIGFADSPWYFDKFIRQRMSIEILGLSQWPNPFAELPQVFSINILEDFVIVARELDLQPHKMIESKLNEKFEQVGDWSVYLNSFRKDISNWNLEILRKTSNEFIDYFS